MYIEGFCASAAGGADWVLISFSPERDLLLGLLEIRIRVKAWGANIDIRRGFRQHVFLHAGDTLMLYRPLGIRLCGYRRQ